MQKARTILLMGAFLSTRGRLRISCHFTPRHRCAAAIVGRSCRPHFAFMHFTHCRCFICRAPRDDARHLRDISYFKRSGISPRLFTCRKRLAAEIVFRSMLPSLHASCRAAAFLMISTHVDSIFAPRRGFSIRRFPPMRLTRCRGQLSGRRL